jgi:hypothetical protein
MIRLHLARKARLTAVLLAATGSLTLGGIALSSSVAHADPPFNSSNKTADFVGVGSNTIEDLMNAESGEEPTAGIPGSTQAPAYYTPLADPTTGDRIYSFDAEDPYNSSSTTSVGCITTKIGGPAFDRPNGSTNGRKALSDALVSSPAVTPWFEAGPPAGCDGTAATAVNVTGQIDWARSSSAPAGPLITEPATEAQCGPKVVSPLVPCITYIPFAHDGVSYAWWAAGGATPTVNVSKLTNAQLNTLYSSANGQLVDGTTTVFACFPQTGSGTASFFAGAIGVTLAQAQAAATANNCYGVEENGANDFVAKANGGVTPAANTAWVVPFSVGSFVAQANLAAQDRSATGRTDGVEIADVNGIVLNGGNSGFFADEPFTGAAPNLVTDTGFDADATWGRNLWVIVPWYKLNGTGLGDKSPAEEGIFGTFAGGAGSGALCGATAQGLLNKFGFTTEAAIAGAPACGTEETEAATPGDG